VDRRLSIGIRWEGTTDGMKDIGLGRHIRGLDGCRLVTTERSSMSVTGMEIEADLNMTTIGTGNATETMIGTATTVTNAARPSDAHT
jgi:hypothetical protein